MDLHVKSVYTGFRMRIVDTLPAATGLKQGKLTTWKHFKYIQSTLHILLTVTKLKYLLINIKFFIFDSEVTYLLCVLLCTVTINACKVLYVPIHRINDKLNGVQMPSSLFNASLFPPKFQTNIFTAFARGPCMADRHGTLSWDNSGKAAIAYHCICYLFCGTYNANIYASFRYAQIY